MGELVCTYCGTRNTDPGGTLDTYECGKCGQRTLVRIHQVPIDNNDKISQAIAGGLIGFALASFIGVPGMLLGAIIGAFLGWSYKS